jgi:hypothetical protein
MRKEMRNLIIAIISLTGMWSIPLVLVIFFDYSLRIDIVILLIGLSLIFIGDIGLEIYNLRTNPPE